MINPGELLSEAHVRHLLRRTGFGPTAKDVKKARLDGLTRGEAASKIVYYKPKKVRVRGKDTEQLHNKWFKKLLKGKSPFQLKLGLFWHDHFSTAMSTVQDTDLMTKQVETLHAFANGNFKDFVKAINVDPAMMEFLDTVHNFKWIPNENYARELCELFTLGVKDEAGNDNYEQEDIVQIARAFTGWRFDDKLVPNLRENRHDYMEDYDGDPEEDRGPKVIFKGAHGFPAGGADFAANGEGEPEIDTVVDIIFQHTDTDGKNTVARRIARRLLEYLAHPDPDLSVIDEVVADSGFATSFNIADLCWSILVHDAFYETAAAAPYGASDKKSVKWPIDYAVSTLRMLKVKPKGKYLEIQGGRYDGVYEHMTNMGQVILNPPSVFGWDWEQAWLSSSTLLARYSFARDIVSARYGGGRFRPEKLVDLDLSDPADIVDAAAEVLGIQDHLTNDERDVLADYLTDQGANPTLDLNDYDTRQTKLNGLFGLLLQSPAYQMQ
jgi:uncharacterized protein (DUF1800 family)